MAQGKVTQYGNALRCVCEDDLLNLHGALLKAVVQIDRVTVSRRGAQGALLQVIGHDAIAFIHVNGGIDRLDVVWQLKT